MSGLLSFWKIGLMQTMAASNRLLFQYQKTRDLFNSFAAYVGSSPFQIPSTFNLIAHAQIERGTYIVEGGMHALAQGLYRFGEELGIRYEFNTCVDSIKLKDGRVNGIRAGDKRYNADIVVSIILMCTMFITDFYRIFPGLTLPSICQSQTRHYSFFLV